MSFFILKKKNPKIQIFSLIPVSGSHHCLPWSPDPVSQTKWKESTIDNCLHSNCLAVCSRVGLPALGLTVPMSETQTKTPKLSPVQKAKKQAILPPAKTTTALGKKPGSPVNGVQLTHHHQRHGLQVLTVLPGESLCVSMKLTALLSSCLGLASSGLNQFLAHLR